MPDSPSDSSSELTFEGTLESYFYEQIGSAQERSGTELSDSIEAYVVHLLAHFARRTGLAGRRSKALALQLLAATSRERSGSARSLALREVGDRALFISGVVPRSMDRSPVNLRYVRSIGQSAYHQLAEGHRQLEVFHDLATRFEEVSSVIGDTVELPESQSGRGASLMELYERWRRHGCSRDERRLIAAGVLLDPKTSDIVQ